MEPGPGCHRGAHLVNFVMLARCTAMGCRIAVILLLACCSRAGAMEAVQLSPDGKSFMLATSGKRFVPWGFNYDHDEKGRLLEDYWLTEWSKVEEDFREMKDLGANVVRIHLQFGQFMETADEPRAAALQQLARLLTLAEHIGLHLNLTGLGCYHQADVPAWYAALTEPARWSAQANFWAAIAQQCRGSPAVFCYDLMNEPVVAGAKRQAGAWLGPAFGGKHFVQFITLDPAGRVAPTVAGEWIVLLKRAIRRHDAKHLVTVGLVDWSLDRPGLRSGFVPEQIAAHLDFLCVHLYPKSGEVPQALATLRGFDVGKPVVIEETFPLQAGLPEFGRFLTESRAVATGWLGFYWGKTPAELRQANTIADAIMLGWLEFFQQEGANAR